MRSLVLFFVLVACVTLTPAAADTTAPEAEDPKESSAFSVHLRVSLPAGDSTLETAFSLVEDLRELPDLGGFELAIRAWVDLRPGASLSATFEFESLPEFLAWHQSDSVQSFLLSLEHASDEPLKLEVRGTMIGK